MYSLSLRRASSVLMAAALLIAAIVIASASHIGHTSASPRWNGGMVSIKQVPVKHPVKPSVKHPNSPRWN